MIINLDLVFKDFYDREIIFNDKPLTVKVVILEVMAMEIPNEKSEKEQKLHRYALGMKLKDLTGEVEISLEDAVLIKDRVKDMWGTLVFGQINDLLK